MLLELTIKEGDEGVGDEGADFLSVVVLFSVT